MYVYIYIYTYICIYIYNILLTGVRDLHCATDAGAVPLPLGRHGEPGPLRCPNKHKHQLLLFMFVLFNN